MFQQKRKLENTIDTNQLENKTNKKFKNLTYSLVSAVKIFGCNPQNKKWLVEWSDYTRTWEPYFVVKDLQVFQEYIEEQMLNKEIKKQVPSYIS